MNSKPNFKHALALGAAATLAACATAPQPNPILDDAKAAYERAATDPKVVRSAPVELQSAQTALQQAQAAHQAGDAAVMEHYAYLSKRRVDTAIEAGKIAAADAAVADAGEQRQRILVELRTREAEAERNRAQASLAQAEAARKAAEEQRMQAEAARALADTARKQAEERLAQAQAARSAAQASDQRAQQLATQLEQLKTKKTDRGMVLTLGDVLFDSGRADLKPGAKQTLTQLATFLKQYPERTVEIEGHTDAVGSVSFNQMLSERRAMSVRDALTDFGISPKRIVTRGFGPAKPIVSNETPAGRQQNRRVEIVLPDTSG